MIIYCERLNGNRFINVFLYGKSGEIKNNASAVNFIEKSNIIGRRFDEWKIKII